MIRTAAALACPSVLALAGCTQVYTSSPEGGPLAFNRAYLNFPVLGERQVMPPLPPGTAFGHDGLYLGYGQALNSQGAQCAEFMRAGRLEVTGRHVTYGPFGGTISREGGLTMIYGQNTVVGQFVGNTFEGVIQFQTPPCSYALRFTREAAS